MASSKKFLAVFLFSLWFSYDFSHGLDGLLGPISFHGVVPTCLQKILPCQQFFQSPVNPPSTCCEPLKEMLEDNLDCLCSVFNNVELLQSLNVTQSTALKLPQACGANVDVSKCKNDKAEPEANPPTGSKDAPTTNSSSNGSSPTSSTHNKPNDSGSTKKSSVGYGFVAAATSSFVAISILLSVSAV